METGESSFGANKNARGQLTYSICKFLHVLGVILLIGNVTVASVWKVFADRTANPVVAAFAQRMVIYTDWTLTGGGVILTMLGGYGMIWEAHLNAIRIPWLLWGQILFGISGAIWLFVLIPIQAAQFRMTKQFAPYGDIADVYTSHSRSWLRWGIAATVPLIAALYLMMTKTTL